MDGREAGSRINSGKHCRMKKPKKTQKKASIDSLKELGQKYGVKVTDMSECGVRAIGILGGVGLRLGTTDRRKSTERSTQCPPI